MPYDAIVIIGGSRMVMDFTQLPVYILENIFVGTQDPLMKLNHFMVVIEDSAEYNYYFTDGHLKWTTIDEKKFKRIK